MLMIYSTRAKQSPRVRRYHFYAERDLGTIFDTLVTTRVVYGRGCAGEWCSLQIMLGNIPRTTAGIEKYPDGKVDWRG